MILGEIYDKFFGSNSTAIRDNDDIEDLLIIINNERIIGDYSSELNLVSQNFKEDSRLRLATISCKVLYFV